MKHLPRDFQGEELAAYVRELLQDDRVQVTELWRRVVSGSAFVVSAPWWHLRVLLDLRNWERHVFVCRYYTRAATAADPQSPVSEGE